MSAAAEDRGPSGGEHDGTSTVTVVEAGCLVPVAVPVRVPFDLTAADTRADVLVLSEAAPAFDLHLEAPDGTAVAVGSAGTDEVVGHSSRFVELHPRVATPAAPTGRWVAVLRLEEARFAAWHDRVRDRLATGLDGIGRERPAPAMAAVARPRRVPVTVLVAATSTLRLESTVALPGGGTAGELRARLVDDGTSVVRGTRVEAHLTAPDGGVRLVGLAADGAEFVAHLGVRVDEVSHVRVVARGVDGAGTPFSREQVLCPAAATTDASTGLPTRAPGRAHDLDGRR